MARAVISILAALVSVSSALAEAPKLELPISCEPGKTCWVQQYVDHDPSTGVKDYACGTQSYDGHDGTDIRVRDTTSIADVIASADGTVTALRDGDEDRLVRTDAARAAVADRECGNGVLIAHANGWETQYCHMREGSVTVRLGDAVKQGQKLGTVGFSGMAAFPHVHLTLRHDGRTIDPFSPGDEATQCGPPQNPLWTEDALTALAYRRSDVIGTGFAPGPVEMEALEEGAAEGVPSAEWPAMVAYMWAINLEKGDVIEVHFEGPEGIKTENSLTLDKAKAQYLLFTGKKRPAGGWPKGLYRARLEISNAGTKRLSQDWEAVID